jgi:hypothetical protein
MSDIEKEKIKGIYSSLIATKIDERKGYKLAGIDIEVLLQIDELNTVTGKKLKEEFPDEDISEITSHLKEQKLIQSCSPTWKLTNDGKKVIQLVNDYYHEVETLVNSDSFLYSLAVASGSINTVITTNQ